MILLYPTKFRVNRIIIRRDIAKRRFSIWRPSAILNLKNFAILLSSRPWKHNLHPHTKFRLNRMISGWDMAIKLFSKWRPSAILNLRNFGILLSSRPWNHNLHLYTKFRWNRMISGWDIAIKLFSKWRPPAILNFRNSVFWSCDLCYKVILLHPTKFRVNWIIIRSFRYSQKTIFNMAAVRHFEFEKFWYFVK